MDEVRLIDANALAESDMAKLIDEYLYNQCNLTVGFAAALMPTIEPDADTYYTAGIKVCPFCEDGGRMSMIETVNGQHYVQCDKCGASRERILADTDGAAIDLWNARYRKRSD